MSLTKASYSMITGAPANVLDYGAVGNGTTDDTAAIQAALNANKHVIVPIGTYLISSTITVPSSTRLSFLGGLGNALGAYPPAYFIKKSTMTTEAVILSATSIMDGGGVIAQSGHTGDVIAVQGNNVRLTNVFVHGGGTTNTNGTGGVGIRVGKTDGTNCNSFMLDHCNAQYCGSHGIYIHDGTAASGANANAGTLIQCFVQFNVGDGIRIGHAFWVTIINSLAETNTGWGLYLSGAANNTYPECRWATIISGDYNEGNTAGIVYDASYFATFINPDIYNLPTTASNGLQGSALRNYVGGTANTFQGLTTKVYQAVFGITGNANAIRTQTIASGSVGDGAGIDFYLDPNTGVYRQSAKIKSYQFNSTQDGIRFSSNNAGSLTSIFDSSYYYNGVTPCTDNTYNLGHPSFRWSTVYATTGSINTSDGNQKQQILSLSDAEKSVAISIKELIKTYKFNDAVIEKGADARIHVGVIAQEIEKAFIEQGLDPNKYALFCSDTWHTLNGERVTEDTEDAVAITQLGIRYDELLCFVIGAM